MPNVHEPGITRTVVVSGSASFAHDPPVLSLERHLTSPDRDVPYERELNFSVLEDTGTTTRHWNGGCRVETLIPLWGHVLFVNRLSSLVSPIHPVKYSDNGDGTYDVWLELIIDVYVRWQYLLSTGFSQRFTLTSAVVTHPAAAFGSPSPYPFEMTEGEVLSGINGLIFRPSEGSFEFDYEAVLYKHTDNNSVWETFRLNYAHAVMEFNPRFTFLDIDETFNCTFDKTRSFPAVFVPITPLVPQRWALDFYNLGPTFQQAGEYTFDEANLLNNSAEVILVETDYLALAGDPHSGTFEYTGSDYQADTIFAPDDPADTNLRSTIPSGPGAVISVTPSWSVGVETAYVDYEDASLIDMEIVHETRHHHTGGTITETEEFNALTGGVLTMHPIPASGELDALLAEIVTEGQCWDPLYDADPGTPGIQLEVYESHFIPETTDPAGHGQTGNVDRPWALLDTEYTIPGGEEHVSTEHFFYIKDAYANSIGLYTKSANKVLKYPEFGLSDRFNTGTILVVANKVFNLFDAGAWAVPHAAGFYVTNPDISGTGVISVSGGATRFTHGAGGARALFRQTEVLKPFSHRYFVLRYLADGAGEQYRFGVGRLGYGSEAKYYWRYAWQWTAPASGWQQVTFDWLEPTHKASVDGSGVLTVDPTTEQIHPSAFLEGVDQATTAWFEMLTTGQVDVDYLEGFLETSGTRTPALLYHGSRVSGNSVVPMELYEPGTTPSSIPYFVIYSPNGASGFGASGAGTINSAWAGLRALLGNGVGGNDTGFTVVLPTHAFAVFDMAGNHDFEHFLGPGPFGEEMTPGVAVQLKQRLRRIGTAITGNTLFYGAGDVQANAYGSTILLRSAHLLRGEVRLVEPNPVAGHQITVHDNPTGAVVYTALTDDDGAARAFVDYGVPKPRSNSSAALSADDPTEFSGGSPPYSYTAQGELLNSYWMKPVGWTAEVDGSGYFADSSGVRRDVTILDGYPNWFLLGLTATLGGIDVAHSYGGTHVTAQVNGEVVVRSTYDRGASWTEVILATGVDDALPTIMWDPETDFLYVWWHNGTNVLAQVSEDHGATWDAWATSYGDPASFPRACWAPEAHYLVVWDDGDLEVWRTDPDVPGYSLSLSVVGVPEQLAELHRDQWGRLHLIYQEDDESIWRRVMDGTWGSATAVVAGVQPVSAAAPGGGGLVVAYESDALVVRPLMADFKTALGTSVTLPDLGEGVQYAGLSYDHFGVAWLAVKLADGSTGLRWSDDGGATWQTL